MTMEIASKGVWRLILSFLSARDFLSLSQTCRICFIRAQENQNILVKQFHLNLAVKQDIYLSHLYQNPEYLSSLTKHGYNSLNSQSSDNIKQFALAKCSLKELILEFCGAENSQRLINVMNEAITSPRLPPLKLRRENMSCETFSLYQMHLNNVYNRDDDESRMSFDAMIDESKMFDFGSILKEKLMAYSEDQKNMILAARWYYSSNAEENFFSNNDDEDVLEGKAIKFKEIETLHTLTKKISKISVKKSSKHESKTKKKLFYEKLASCNYSRHQGKSNEANREVPLLVEFNQHLVAFFTSYCRIVLDGLENIKNPFFFISEYSTKWKNYTISMQILGGYLRGYSQMMNQVYETAFGSYANYPEFRIWRMMAKIWHNEVFCKLLGRINDDFTKVLNIYLNSFGVGFEKYQDYQILNEELCSGNFPDMFLGSSEIDVSSVIGDCFNSILDIALNERTVFNVTCFDLTKLGSASGFCSTFQEFIKNRCIAILQEPSLKASYKFELIKSTIELIENFLPFHCFPEVFEILIEGLQSALTEFISEQNISIENIGSNFLQESELQYILGGELTETIQLAYPTLKQHLQYFKKKLTLLKNIVCEREKKVTANTLKGFSLSICEMEKTFMDISGEVTMDVLEECRMMYLE